MKKGRTSDVASEGSGSFDLVGEDDDELPEAGDVFDDEKPAGSEVSICSLFCFRTLTRFRLSERMLPQLLGCSSPYLPKPPSVVKPASSPSSPMAQPKFTTS